MSTPSDLPDIAHLARTVRTTAAALTPRERADLLVEVCEAIYNAVIFDNPKGGSMDGRDGAERMSIAHVVDAAQAHHDNASSYFRYN